MEEERLDSGRRRNLKESRQTIQAFVLLIDKVGPAINSILEELKRFWYKSLFQKAKVQLEISQKLAFKKYLDSSAIFAKQEFLQFTIICLSILKKYYYLYTSITLKRHF